MPDPFLLVVNRPERADVLRHETVPPATTTRWNPKRKAQVVRAIEAGELSHDEACRRYRMTLEELLGWQRALCESGEPGLRATRRIRPRWTDPFESDWYMQESVHRDDRRERSH